MKKIHKFFKLYNYSIKDVKGRWGRVEGRGDQVKRIHNRRIRTSSYYTLLYSTCGKRTRREE
jgi:hypothetical protein